MSHITIDTSAVPKPLKYFITITEPNSSKSIEESPLGFPQDLSNVWLSPKSISRKPIYPIKQKSKQYFNMVNIQKNKYTDLGYKCKETFEFKSKPLRKVGACLNLNEVIKNCTMGLDTLEGNLGTDLDSICFFQT
ncbi:hypothetical protein SteCoe_8806 [Stentor coeruleus]|uniref:Uncharacterized protein n=1 Tax=Stentor coeruleus TaxID=5963 RepID=A0A1R2CJF4_9CILI|nr:hypothetical protein SteCoe_8806 [Stentor coeruleus]